MKHAKNNDPVLVSQALGDMVDDLSAIEDTFVTNVLKDLLWLLFEELPNASARKVWKSAEMKNIRARVDDLVEEYE